MSVTVLKGLPSHHVRIPISHSCTSLRTRKVFTRGVLLPRIIFNVFHVVP